MTLEFRGLFVPLSMILIALGIWKLIELILTVI